MPKYLLQEKIPPKRTRMKNECKVARNLDSSIFVKSSVSVGHYVDYFWKLIKTELYALHCKAFRVYFHIKSDFVSTIVNALQVLLEHGPTVEGDYNN